MSDPISDFEQSTQMLPPETSVLNLVELLMRLEEKTIHLNIHDSPKICSRIVHGFSHLITNPALQLQQTTYEILCHFSPLIRAIFKVAQKELIELRKTIPRDNIYSMRRHWCVSTLDDLEEHDFSALLKSPAEIRIPTTIGMLSTTEVFNLAAEKNRVTLIDYSEQLLDGNMGQLLVTKFAKSWMRCSYVDYAKKYELKRNLNQLARRWLSQANISDSILDHKKCDHRPTLAIIAEKLYPNHAMYRCYAAAIQQLKDKFHVVLVIAQPSVDKRISALANETIYLGKIKNFDRIVNTIKDITPSIIYYPSLGMANWTVFICNLRLAPLQVMSLGHPATSMSQNIDWVITEVGVMGDPHAYSERIFTMRKYSFPYLEHSERGPSVLPIISDSPSVLKIVIPSNAFKLNAHFLEALQYIAFTASRPLEFNFFPARDEAISHLAVTAELKTMFSASVNVYPYMDYASYLKLLNQCDLHFSPFPFGGTNSNLDSLGQGIPVLCKESYGAQAECDAEMIRRVGLGDDLVTSSSEAYINRALELIHNDHLRRELSYKILRTDYRKIYFNIPTDIKNEFVDTMWWLYQQWDTIKTSSQKVYSYEDRQSLTLPQTVVELNTHTP